MVSASSRRTYHIPVLVVSLTSEMIVAACSGGAVDPTPAPAVPARLVAAEPAPSAPAGLAPTATPAITAAALPPRVTTPPKPAGPAQSSRAAPTDPAARTIYDRASSILGDTALSYSDRRNRLRVVRRSVGDAAFFPVIVAVPLYDAKTGKTVTFAEYMEDLAATYIGHPDAPISFDPVGAATQIYFSPTEQTVREMTGIGIELARVLEGAQRYREPLAQVEAKATVAAAVEAPAPAFVSHDPRLRSAYDRAKVILTSSQETDTSRRKKLRVLQDEVGQETLTLILRYVPVVDREEKTVQSFDSYMRELAGSYDSGRGSPIDRDPVGATMRIFFDPSPETISAMTGIGLSDSERRRASRQYGSEQVDISTAAREIVSGAVSQFDWGEVKKSAGTGVSQILSIFDSD